MSRIGDWAFRGLIGALLFFGCAEIAVRLLQPPPRVQVITPGGTATMEQPLTDLHGVPVWRDVGSAARARCGAAHTLLILGTSISFGIELPANAVFSAALQAELDRRAPGQWCVRNEAQPGFTLDSIMGLARERVPALRPDLVLLELGNLGSYTLIDGAAPIAKELVALAAPDEHAFLTQTYSAELEATLRVPVDAVRAALQP